VRTITNFYETQNKFHASKQKPKGRSEDEKSKALAEINKLKLLVSNEK
jgi:hypothetical protein